MSEEELRDLLMDVLMEIAPDIDATELETGEDLREQTEIDSMDFLNFAIAVYERTGVEIAESDYPKLVSIDALVAYVGARLAGAVEP